MIQVEITGIRELESSLLTMASRYQSLFGRALRNIGLEVQKQAIRFCPKSPSKEQYVSTLKTGVTKRDNFNPGGLERSITTRTSESLGYVDVFVPANSEAGKYAERMHEDNYNPGVGSQAKANQYGVTVGRKFLERAVDDRQTQIGEILQSYVDEMVDKENR